MEEIDDYDFYESFFLKNTCKLSPNQTSYIAFVYYNFAVMFLLPLLVSDNCAILVLSRLFLLGVTYRPTSQLCRRRHQGLRQ